MTNCLKSHWCGGRRRGLARHSAATPADESLISPHLRLTIPDGRSHTLYRVHRKSYIENFPHPRLGGRVRPNQAEIKKSNQNQTASNQKMKSTRPFLNLFNPPAMTAIVPIASHLPCHSPSPGGDLSRLGNGERNLAQPKAARPSERARASQRRDEGELKTYSKLKNAAKFQSTTTGEQTSLRTGDETGARSLLNTALESKATAPGDLD